jgi:hypothetical protein
MPIMTLKRFDILSVAKQAGVLYGLLGLLIGCIFALISVMGLAAGMASSSDTPSWLAPLFGIGAIIIAPIFYGVIGFLGGLIMSALYNFVAGITGGVQVDLS